MLRPNQYAPSYGINIPVSVLLLLAQPGGGFAVSPAVDARISNYTDPYGDYQDFSASYSMFAGDFNGDGRLDLVVYDTASPIPSEILFNGGGLVIYLGNGDGTFRAGATATFPGSIVSGDVGQTNSLTVADFNGDGHPDLALTTIQGQTLAVFLGFGNGEFTALVMFSQATGGFGGSASVAVADFSSDGNLDLLLAELLGVARLLSRDGHTWPSLASLGPNQPLPPGATGN